MAHGEIVLSFLNGLFDFVFDLLFSGDDQRILHRGRDKCLNRDIHKNNLKLCYRHVIGVPRLRTPDVSDYPGLLVSNTSSGIIDTSKARDKLSSCYLATTFVQ
jgi:hypothetical protein